MNGCNCDDENELNLKVDDIIRYYCNFSFKIINGGEHFTILKIYKDNNECDMMSIKSLSNNNEIQEKICSCTIPSKQKKVADNDWVDKDGNHYNNAGVKQ